LTTFDDGSVARALASLVASIEAQHGRDDTLALVGVRTGGAHLAARLVETLARRRGAPVPLGVLDITLYRDDVLVGARAMPILRGTEIPFDVEGRTIVLVDDVLYTGRTVRAALDAILDLGRPRAVRLAVLVDRGHRELPIAADHTGIVVDTTREERVSVQLTEEGHSKDALVLLTRDAPRATSSGA